MAVLARNHGSAHELLGRFGPGERARSAILPGFEPALDDVFAA